MSSDNESCDWCGDELGPTEGYTVALPPMVLTVCAHEICRDIGEFYQRRTAYLSGGPEATAELQRRLDATFSNHVHGRWDLRSRDYHRRLRTAWAESVPVGDDTVNGDAYYHYDTQLVFVVRDNTLVTTFPRDRDEVVSEHLVSCDQTNKWWDPVLYAVCPYCGEDCESDDRETAGEESPEGVHVSEMGRATPPERPAGPGPDTCLVCGEVIETGQFCAEHTSAEEVLGQ